MATLKDKQAEAVVRMLNLNVAAQMATSVGWGEQWKLLIYDRFCRDVISPLLNVSQLRKQGITLHMLSETDREEIPDVPAIYFVLPTPENVQRIVQDAQNKLYSSFHLNFARPIPRPLLENFAKSTLSTDTVGLIQKLFDQTLDFVCLEPRLFSLREQNSYMAYNNPKAKDTDIEQYMERIVAGLFSVIATLGTVPVIQAPTGGPAEMVARNLNAMLKGHLTGGSKMRSGLFADNFASAGFQRPVLIIVDRNLDLVTPVHHTSTYQALVDDLLDLRMNRVSIGQGKEKKTYDLDPSSDAFYQAFGGSPFPEAIEANAQQLNEVTAKEEAIKNGGGGGGGEDVGQGTKDLVKLVDALPALMEKKKALEQHTAILQGAMDLIASRDVPTLYETSNSMVTTGSANKKELLAILSDPEKGSILDKLRLLTVCHLSTNTSEADIAELEATLAGFAMKEMNQAKELEAAAAKGGKAAPAATAGKGGGLDDIKALAYLKKHQHFKQKMTMDGMSGAAASTPKAGGMFSFAADLSSLTNNVGGALLAKAAASVKSFIPSSNYTYCTRVAKAVCENKGQPTSDTESFLYLDAKVKTTGGAEPPRQKTPFQEAIVFVIGGGNYAEHQNLQDYAKNHSVNITYGCTEMLNAERFLEQLRELGKMG